jgi:hypothetical protein
MASEEAKVTSFISEMTSELAQMARADGRSDLAFLLGMAALQAASEKMRECAEAAMRSSPERHDMSANVTYLREQAHRCVRLARDCPHTPTSHALEAIGIELMEHAAELDHIFCDATPSEPGEAKD